MGRSGAASITGGNALQRNDSAARFDDPKTAIWPFAQPSSDRSAP